MLWPHLVDLHAAGIVRQPQLGHSAELLEPGRWDLCTLFDVNYRPGGMTVDELRRGMYWLTERLYNAGTTAARRGPFFENKRGRPVRT